MLGGGGLLVIQPIADRCSVKNLFENSHYIHHFVLVQEQHTSDLNVLQKDMVVFIMLSYEQSFSNLFLIPKHVNNTIEGLCDMTIYIGWTK